MKKRTYLVNVQRVFTLYHLFKMESNEQEDIVLKVIADTNRGQKLAVNTLN